MSSTPQSQIQRDRVSTLYDAFDRNYPITLSAVETIFGGAGWSRPNLEKRLRDLGAEPAHEHTIGGRVRSRWWWPFDIARAMWGDDVARRIVQARDENATEVEP